MKKIIVFTCAMLLIASLQAQITPDAQKEIEKAKAMLKDPSIAAKLKMAQKMSDSIANNANTKSKLQKANTELNKAKAEHPNEVSNVQLPNSINTKTPSADAITAEMNSANSLLQSYNQQVDQTMPKRDISKHADKLLQLSKNNLLVMAQYELDQLKPKLTFNEKDTINLLMKNTDNNLAGIGVFILSSGGSKIAGSYLICEGVTKKPDNKWSVNDMGVMFRNMQLYKQALQCFFYASELDSEKSVVINTNIGWASAYYGDFETAQEYFDKALAIDNNFSSALEGEAILAYQKGDIAALFQCLAKEIKYFGGSGGGSMNEPSDEFVSTCGEAASKNNQSNMDNQSDPTNDNTFNNSNDDEPDQDAPPTADVEPVSYPTYRKVFVNSAKDLIKASPDANKLIHDYYEKQKNYQAQLTQKLSSLKPLDQRPYTDDEGNVIYPNKFKKYVDLIAQVRIQLDKRTVWYYQKYLQEINDFLKTLSSRDIDLVQQYEKAFEPCGKAADEQKCDDRVNCAWIPKLLTIKNSDLEAAGRIWNKYSDNIRKTVQWYLDATAPFIKRVHAEGWNEYLNMQREVDVRMAILKTYNCWCSDIIYLGASPLCGIIQQNVPSCPIDINGMDAPDPTSKKPKHIKEFEGPCYNNSFDMGIGGIEEDCHKTKFSIGKGPFKVFYEHVDDPLYAQDKNYSSKAGLNVGLDTWLGVNDEESGLKAGVNAKLEGTAWLKFDANGNITGGGSEVAASGSIGVKGEVSGMETGGSIGTGVSVSTEWQVVAGQTQVVGNPATVKMTGSGD